MSEPSQSLLSFQIGPVQSFIEAARTVRDLWSGSYLLSWLAASAMRPILTNPECGPRAFITPHVTADHPMLMAQSGHRKGNPAATLPSLPNRFAALVPNHKSHELAHDCVAECRAEWKKICDRVKDALDPVASPSGRFADWARSWDAQVSDFFEIHCVHRVVDTNCDVRKPKDWNREWERLGALLESTRSVRHVPNYAAVAASDGQFPSKCSLLGSYEQMGPANLTDSGDFWKSLSEWEGLKGTRVQSSDRLCAISLVKRFLWPAYLADEKGKLGLNPRELRFSDTATIAAAKWLDRAPDVRPYDPATRRWQHKDWNGQWLHWPTRDFGDEPCPAELFSAIQASRRKLRESPPLYYALLHMDGDNMGRLFQGSDSEWGSGVDRCRAITERLTTFSLKHVERVVEQHSGELVYAGGDDVLALLPAATVLDCATTLHAEFARPELLGSKASLSAGIAIVHYKEDLRHALSVVRAAEKTAKRIARGAAADRTTDGPQKDAVAVSVCRHSGADSTVVTGWKHTAALGELVKLYLRESPPSDRWSYKFVEEFTVLEALPPDAVRIELLRLLKRAEDPTDQLAPCVMGLYDSYLKEMMGDKRGWTFAASVREFAGLCQTASFLARGRE